MRPPSTIMLNAMKSKPRGEVIAVVLLFSALLCQAQTVSPKRPCAQLLEFGAPVVEISKAEPVPATNASPPYCLVQGTINKRIGAGGKQFGIGFELRLPDIWTERFLFQGGGGMDGVVRPATGAVPISGSTAMPALARGFAVATTDSGHQGQGGPIGAAADASFGVDQQARVDQAYGGFMAVTELARQMIAQLLWPAVEEVLLHGLFQRRAASSFGGAALSTRIRRRDVGSPGRSGGHGDDQLRVGYDRVL